MALQPPSLSRFPQVSFLSLMLLNQDPTPSLLSFVKARKNRKALMGSVRAHRTVHAHRGLRPFTVHPHRKRPVHAHRERPQSMTCIACLIL